MKFLGIGNNSKTSTINYSIFEISSDKDMERGVEHLRKRGSDICFLLHESTVDDILKKWQAVKNLGEGRKN